MSDDSTRFVAFIRNVMIGRAGLTQEVLLRCFAAAGAQAPRSHYATGNVSFNAVNVPADDVIDSVQASIADVMGRFEPVFARSVATLRSVINESPFVDSPIDDVQDRCVTFTATTDALTLPIESTRGDAFIYARRGTDFYSVTRLVGGRTGSPNLMIERALSCRASTRNWNTIERIITSLEKSASTAPR